MERLLSCMNVHVQDRFVGTALLGGGGKKHTNLSDFSKLHFKGDCAI